MYQHRYNPNYGMAAAAAPAPSANRYRDIVAQAQPRVGFFQGGGPLGAGIATPGVNGLLNPALLAAAGMTPAQIDAIMSAACNVGCCPPPEPVVGRVVPVGLPNKCIEACECEDIDTTVCGPFTLTGLFIPLRVACKLSITRIQLGCWTMLTNCDPIPAEMFSCCEIDENWFGARPIEANSKICIEVENKSEVDVQFEGALKGVLCQPC